MMMMPFKKSRERGFTLVEQVLVIAGGLALIASGVIYYQQTQVSSAVAEKTRAAVSVSSEITAQFRTSTTFDALDLSPATAPARDITDIASSSGLPDAAVSDLEVVGVGQEFDLIFSNLDSRVCERLAADPGALGVNVTVDAADCGIGDLTVTYAR